MSNRNQIAGIVLIVVGVLFLFGRGLSGIDFGRLAWPFFVLVPGLLLLGSAFFGGRKSAHLALPGSIVSSIGIILLVLNVTDYWQAWAYCWSVIIVGVGIGNLLYGSLSNDHLREQDGIRTIYVGLTLFAVFGAFFEFLIWGGFGGTLRWLLPVLLIGGGLYLLLRKDQAKGPFTVKATGQASVQYPVQSTANDIAQNTAQGTAQAAPQDPAQGATQDKDPTS